MTACNLSLVHNRYYSSVPPFMQLSLS